ncbi:PREDICTED: F-box protein FBW2 isoform X2 [Nelumbo nucifera]|nr:PREDICTED: F-box protein FBW2 isoform X2 [Nelumbo nucifera]XP_010273022.1 PREDICTED: F-box protein FBW2 isoform X2 [Nelumbo nucifera]
MEEEGEFRSWDELIPDALGLIFKNLSLQETLTVIPRVCKSWNRAVMGPYCWQEIDIKEWSLRCQPEQLDRMLKMLIRRSCGSLRKLCVSGLPNEPILSFIADHAGSLQTLQLPRSEISDSMVEQVADRLSTISFLDLSYCGKIGARALEAIGKHCKLLVGLRRVMHPLEVEDRFSQDDEAHAIATTMPKLKHLEMAYLLITTEGVLEILSNCRELEFLDIRGCWDVKLDEKFLKEKYSGLKVLGPLIVDCYERTYWDDCSDYSDSSSYLDWDFVAGELYDGESSDGVWDDEQRFEELELRFYQGFEEDAAFEWPQSP